MFDVNYCKALDKCVFFSQSLNPLRFKSPDMKGVRIMLLFLTLM